MANQQRPPLAAGDDHANPAQIDEAYEALDGMKRIEPCTPVEACDWLQIRPERYPRWAQAVLERELEAISRMARAFRNRDDKESVALVRQIDARCAQLRGGSRPGARLPSARACEYEKPDALEIGSSAPGLTSSTGAWPVIEVSGSLQTPLRSAMRQFVRELSYPQYDVSQDSHHAVPAKATCVSAEAGPSSNAHNARVVALRVPFGLPAGLPD